MEVSSVRSATVSARMESFIKHLSIDTVERDTTGGPETHRSAERNSATATGEEPGVGGCPGGR
jgi:hypothetical protein